MNYLITEKKRVELIQCYTSIRGFLLSTCSIMIESLSPIAFNQFKSKEKQNHNFYNEPKHILLLKTMYGMADEMLTKNFIEEKKTNQKNMFDKDYIENSRAKDGRSSNFAEMMESLK